MIENTDSIYLSHSSANGAELSTQLDNTETLLTLKEIAKRIGVSYDRLRGFADGPGMKAALGALGGQGGKGVRYPESAEQLFALLIQAQNEHLVTPATAPAFLSRSQREDGAAQTNGQALVRDTNGQSPQLTPDRAESRGLARNGAALTQETLVDAIVEAFQRVLPPADDRLLTRDQAAQLLACAPGSVRRYVRPCKRGRWRRSDIYIYIVSLGQPFGSKIP